MRSSAFIIFLSIVLLIYASVNYYIYIRGLQCIPQNSSIILYYKITFSILVFSYIVSRFLERFTINYLTNVLTWLGSFWLAAMLFFLLFILLFNILRLGNSFLPTQYSLHPTPYLKLILGISISCIVGLIIIGGYINTLFPRVRHLELSIHKKVTGSKTLHIVAASDIHLGTVINKNRASYLVNKINSLKPDLVIFAGDILDEVIAPVVKYNIGDILKQIKVPLGVYAINGNHEYIGGIAAADKYISEHNITLLRDTAVFLDNRFYIVGREDRDKFRFTGIARKSLSELMQNVNKSYPIILLDHQPFHLEDAVNYEIDFQLSGHTHHAQIWPLNYITQKIYELDWGYLKKGNTQYYVSDGFGTWGPPVRIGNRPEIVDIYLKFD